MVRPTTAAGTAAAALALALALAGCVSPTGPEQSPGTPPPATSTAPLTSSPPPTASATPGSTPSSVPGPSTEPTATTAVPTAPGRAPSSAPATAPPASAPPAPTLAAPHPTPALLPETVAPLTIYYIAMDDGGASGAHVGCGDSVVATFTAPERFRDQVGPTMRRLLADHRPLIGQSGLYNALYQSDLAYISASYDGHTITVWLTGSFMLAGTCDIPRAKAQLEHSAMTAAGAASALVYVNGIPIDDVLSLR